MTIEALATWISDTDNMPDPLDPQATNQWAVATAMRVSPTLMDRLNSNEGECVTTLVAMAFCMGAAKAERMAILTEN